MQNSRFNPRYSKAKGTGFESSIIECLVNHGVVDAERRRLSGVNDKGDIAGIRRVVVESKAERSYKPLEWLREADTEAANAKADFGVVWAKLNGKAKAVDGVVMMRPKVLIHLLLKAGYLDPNEVPEVLSGNVE